MFSVAATVRKLTIFAVILTAAAASAADALDWVRVEWGGRSQHAVAFDASRGQLVLFGGFSNGQPHDDT